MEPVKVKRNEDDDFEPQQKPSSWHRPPVIVPNYGQKSKRNSLLPKSKVQHVLLHDNKYQKNILQSRVSHMSSEYRRSSRLFELHKRSFLIRQSLKQVGLWERGIDHVQILPELVVELHCPGTSREAASQSPMARRMANLTRELNLRESPPPTPTERLTRMKSMDVFDAVPEEESADVDKTNNIQLNNKQSTKSVNNIARLKSRLSEYDRPENNNSSRQMLRREKTASSIPIPTDTDKNENWTRPTTDVRKRSIQRQRSDYFDRSKSAMPLQNDSNMTKNFSTYNYSRRREATVHNERLRREVVTEDPRFKDLKKQLIPAEKPVDGFLQLSPGGRKVIQKYGGSLYNEHELQDLLNKYNNMNFMSTKRIHSAQLKMKAGKRRVMPVKEAFVDDASVYSSLANSSLVLSEAE